MEDANLTDDNLLLNKMEINLHMLGALMLNEIGEDVHDTDVIAVDKDAPRRRTLELMEQLAQQGGLSDVVGDGTVLSFRAALGDDHLSFGRPGHQVVPQKHRAAGCRAACVRTVSLINVGVDDEVGAGRAA
jgi:hypothetical protein